MVVGMRAQTGSLDDIRQALEQSSMMRVQEKVFIHTDNNAYFVGDTLWYKAYVVRADDLRFTDMSRILYVELLNPDGLLVERQQIIVSDKGYSNGNFHITDSLYSGYYELRAYTRWMLNFNVSHKRHSRQDDRHFYSYAMANDYFRTWDGLYSRVFPVYLKPETEGDYSARYLMGRPKGRLPEPPKRTLKAAFFPEGGHLIKGVANRVAFELTDQDGQAVELSGVVDADGVKVADLKTVHMGRGSFEVTPTDTEMKAHFTWNGKEYDFDLPKAEDAGVAITVTDGQAKIISRGLPADKEYGVSILCRGALQHFQSIVFAADNTVSISLPPLPTGVNNITVFSSDGQILADRLFFVNNHDYDADTLCVVSSSHPSPAASTPITYQPHERVDLSLGYAEATQPMLLSVSVRDAGTDADSYDDGNIMTDLLLSSELKGFIANPAYYFASADKERAKALDLLMMVQGWRKYKWTALANPKAPALRYKPEQSMTVEGGVYKMYGFETVEWEEVQRWAEGKAAMDEMVLEDPQTMITPDGEVTVGGIPGGETTDGESTGFYEVGGYEDVVTTQEEVNDVSLRDANAALGVNHGPLKKEVYVEVELYLGNQFAGATQLTNNGGRYLFEIPPFYGTSVLNMKAYTPKDSLKKNMASLKDKHAFNDEHYPDFYVKRDLFYPIFAKKYNYYQINAPEYVMPEYLGVFSELSMENDVQRLKNVDVDGNVRRDRRGTDYAQPVYVRNAFDLYNDMTDYGLMWGKYDLRMFPLRASRFLFGNMNRYNDYNIAVRHNNFTFYRNFTPLISYTAMAQSYQNLLSDIQLRRLQDIRFYTDFELRNDDYKMVIDTHSPDLTLDFVSIPDNGRQRIPRDRHIYIQGFNAPAQFYHRDYSTAKPAQPNDYRRTLYWNPNARTDAEGKLNISFYNNSKQTRIKVTAAGITPDGKLVRY